MAGETNNEAYVSTGKPKVGGAVFVGATSLTPPTDAVTALPAGFAGMGYISEDGVTQSQEVNSEEVKAWGGDTVLNIQTDKADTFQFTLIEVLNVDVLKVVFGDDNVTGTLATGITITANSDEPVDGEWVFDMTMRDGAAKRVVIPCGKITAIGDVTYSDSAAVGYQVTVSAQPDSAGNTHYEYVLKA